MIKAMTRALEHGVPKWRYIETILQSWRDKGIKSLVDVRLEELEFKGRKKKEKRTDIDRIWKKAERNVPDWFEERKVQNARHKEFIRQETEQEFEKLKDPKHSDKTRRELEDLLKGFRS